MFQLYSLLSLFFFSGIFIPELNSRPKIAMFLALHQLNRKYSALVFSKRDHNWKTHLSNELVANPRIWENSLYFSFVFNEEIKLLANFELNFKLFETFY